jgi:hypothetical protein
LASISVIICFEHSTGAFTGLEISFPRRLVAVVETYGTRSGGTLSGWRSVLPSRDLFHVEGRTPFPGHIWNTLL